jgi:cation:H+ antiporter
MTYILVLGGLALLFVGAEALIRGSVSIARKLNVSELVIGLTLVGFGTSMPELLTSLRAISEGSVGLAVGNIVGSSIANIFLVLGLAVLVAPITVRRNTLVRDGVVLIATTLLMCALLWFDAFGRMTGTVLLALLIAYLAYSLTLGAARAERADETAGESSEVADARYGLGVGLVLVIAGIAALVFGSGLVVSGAGALARAMGVSEVVIGLTVVSAGTCLPELVTALTAAFRNRGSAALGAIMGSNIFNVLGVLGLTALVHPFTVRGDLSAIALAGGEPVSMVSFVDTGALVLSAALLVLFAMTGRKIARWEGAVLLLGYVVYLGLTFGVLPSVEIIPRG